MVVGAGAPSIVPSGFVECRVSMFRVSMFCIAEFTQGDTEVVVGFTGDRVRVAAGEAVN